MRHGVVPQAIRRVIPPLLNDFIGLQKDTARINALGLLDVVSRSLFVNNSRGTLTAYSMAALLFLLVTIPFTRWLDGLIKRQQAKTLAGRGSHDLPRAPRRAQDVRNQSGAPRHRPRCRSAPGRLLDR